MDKTELLQAIKEDRLADYVAQNYWKWDKEQMKGLILQLIFTLDDNKVKASKIDTVELLERLNLDDEKFNVVILNQDDEGNYWSEVIRSYDDYERASLAAAEFHGYVEEVDK